MADSSDVIDEKYLQRLVDVVSKQRFLQTTEIVQLLTAEITPLELSRTPPSRSDPPESGSLLLYDRTLTRFYRNDGHKWQKKNNHGNKIREDRVLLRLDGRLRVMGWYAHGQAIPTLSRRAYHLLAEGKSPSETDKINGRENNLVLLHYLDKSKIIKDHEVECEGEEKKQDSTVAGRKRTSKSDGNALMTPQEAWGDDVRRSPPMAVMSPTDRILSDDIFPPTLQSEEQLLVPSELLPDVVYRPDQVPLQSSQRISIFVDGSLPESSSHMPESFLPSSSSVHCKRFAAFVDIATTASFCGGSDSLSGCPSLLIQNVSLSGVSRQEDGTYACVLPRNITRPGHRSIVVVEVAPEACTVHVGAGIQPPPRVTLEQVEESVRSFLQAQCNEALRAVSPTSGQSQDASQGKDLRPAFFESPTIDEGAGVRLLSQLSRGFIEIVPHVDARDTSECLKLSDPGTVFDRLTTEPSTSVRSWLSSPRFDDIDETLEKNALSFTEMSTALADIHGVAPGKIIPQDTLHSRDRMRGLSCVVDDFLVSDAHLEYMDAAIEMQIPEGRKYALRRFQSECPELVTKEFQKLYIASYEDYLVAAQKYCHYWELRLELFGPEKAFLPMTLNGALRDDVDFIGDVQLTHVLYGAEDTFGRSVIWTDLSQFFPTKHDLAQLWRSCFYWYDIASKETAHPSRGIIVVADLTKSRVANMDTNLPMLFNLRRAFPLKLCAHHYINFPWFQSIVFPVVKCAMEPEHRQRLVGHQGSPEEVSRSLAQYGLVPTCLPPGPAGGQFHFDVVDFLRTRKASGL